MREKRTMLNVVGDTPFGCNTCPSDCHSCGKFERNECPARILDSCPANAMEVMHKVYAIATRQLAEPPDRDAGAFTEICTLLEEAGIE